MEAQLTPELAARIKELNGGLANTMIVTFYVDAILDEKRTNGWMETRYDPVTGEKREFKHPGEGRGQVYMDVPFIEIRAPGDTLQVIRRPSRPFDKLRFSQEWTAFEQNATAPAIGTPLERLPFLTKAQVLEFQAGGMRTGENLANTSDANGQKYMDFQRVRQRARDFLAAQAGNAPLEEMRRELEGRDGQIEAQAEQIRMLIEKVEALGKKK